VSVIDLEVSELQVKFIVDTFTDFTLRFLSFSLVKYKIHLNFFE
jgi:hypothetical protein